MTEYLISNNFVFKLSARGNDSLPKLYLTKFYQVLASISIVDVKKFEYLTIDVCRYTGGINVKTKMHTFAIVVSNIDLLYNIVMLDDCKNKHNTCNEESKNDSKILKSSLSSLDKSSIKHYQSFVIKLI